MTNLIEKLNNVSLKFLEPLSLAKTFELVIHEAMKLLNATHGSVNLKINNRFKRIYSTHPVLYRLKLRNKGYLHKSLTTKKALFVNINKIEKDFPQIKKLGVRTILFIPLSYQGISIGALTIYFIEIIEFSESELNALELFGSLSTLAIQKAETSEKEKKALEEKNYYLGEKNILTKINNAALKFSAPLSLEETYKTIVDEAIKLVDGKYGTLMLERDGEFKRVYTTLPISVTVRRKGTSYKAFKESKVYLIHILESKDFMKNHPEHIALGIRSVILIPLSYKKKSIGVLSVNFVKKETISEKELNILLAYGSLASIAIRKSQLNQETLKAVEARDVFISMIAHELRTPLTAINGYIQLLHSKSSAFELRYKTWIETLLSESQRFNLLINKLLEVNRINEGNFKLHWQICSVKEIINNSINNFNKLFPSRKIVFIDKISDLEDKIVGNPEKLEQVVSGILENAAKFSQNSTVISVELMLKDRDIIIVIKDEGKGIVKKEIPLIFEKFHATQKEDGSLGIGLFFVKNIIKQHHGDIKITSRINKGTKVEICLPKIKYGN